MTISDRRARTRASLRTAAMTVFARAGIMGAPIEEICETAGMTRGAFYSNYSSKDELVLDIIEQLHASVTEDARTLLTDLGQQCAAGFGASAAAEGAAAGEGGTAAEGAAAGEGGAAGPAEAARMAVTEAPGAVTQKEKEAILSGILSHFRFPFSHTPAALITYREISVHALRNPSLLARMHELTEVHATQLHAVIDALLVRHGARLLIDARDLVAICTGCYEVAADEAVAGRATGSAGEGAGGTGAGAADHVGSDGGVDEQAGGERAGDARLDEGPARAHPGVGAADGTADGGRVAAAGGEHVGATAGLVDADSPIEVDTSRLLAVLMAFVRFPGEA